jgi:hypothetical protein
MDGEYRADAFALYQGHFRPNKEIGQPEGVYRRPGRYAQRPLCDSIPFGAATCGGPEMKLALALLLLALAAALALLAPPTYAHMELTEADPPDSAHLDAPPEVVHRCFSQPVITEDVTAFDFDYLMPDGRSLDLRIGFRAAPSPSAAPQETRPSLTPSPEAGGAVVDASDDRPDILFLALITTAAAGGAAVLFTLAHLLRKGIGYEPHRPPEGGEEGDGH